MGKLKEAIKTVMLGVMVGVLAVVGSIVIYSVRGAFTEPTLAPTVPIQELGKIREVLNGTHDSSAIGENRDGSVMQRLEYIINHC